MQNDITNGSEVAFGFSGRLSEGSARTVSYMFTRELLFSRCIPYICICQVRLLASTLSVVYIIFLPYPGY